jgi:peptide/nickel transport system permease protein
MAGLAIIGVYILLAVAGPLIASYDPEGLALNVRLAPPSMQHWLGTDSFGRDVLSRILWGAHITIGMAAAGTLCGLVGGVPIGLFSGYLGGRTDEAVMRAMDVIMSFPALLLALLVVAIIGGGSLTAVASVGIVFTPKVARVVRGVVLDLRVAPFVKSAVARGESRGYILFREILPNLWPPIIVEACIRMSYAVILFVSLSYLGLGAQPPAPEWGLMVSREGQYLLLAPWAVLSPAAFIVVFIIGVNLLGDGLGQLLVARSADHD